MHTETTRLAPIPEELTVEIPKPAVCESVRNNGNLDKCEFALRLSFDRFNTDRATLRKAGDQKAGDHKAGEK